MFHTLCFDPKRTDTDGQRIQNCNTFSNKLNERKKLARANKTKNNNEKCGKMEKKNHKKMDRKEEIETERLT